MTGAAWGTVPPDGVQPFDPHASALARRETDGHRARTGHALAGYYVTAGGLSTLTRTCCGPDAHRVAKIAARAYVYYVARPGVAAAVLALTDAGHTFADGMPDADDDMRAAFTAGAIAGARDALARPRATRRPGV